MDNSQTDAQKTKATAEFVLAMLGGDPVRPMVALALGDTGASEEEKDRVITNLVGPGTSC